MTARALLALAALLVSTSTAQAGGTFRIPGHDLNRDDLGYDFFRRFGSPANPDVVALKGADGAFRTLRVGEFRGFWPVCVEVSGCRKNSSFRISTHIPAHAYGIAFTGDDYYGADYVGASLFEPDQVTRKTSGNSTQISIKQKANVLLLLGSWEFNSGTNTGNTLQYQVPGCKAQAKIKTTTAKQDTRFKVSCKQASIDDILEGAAPDLEQVLGALGLKKPVLDFRGSRPIGLSVGQLPFRIPGHDLDRDDLGYDFFYANRDAYAPIPPGGPPIDLKGVANVEELDLRLRIGEATGNSNSVCDTVPSCINHTPQHFNTRVPAFAYGVAEKGGIGTAHYVAASLWEPDQVKRKASAKSSSVKIKQKAYVMLIEGEFTSASPGYTFKSWALEGCKGQAAVKTTDAKQTSKLKVSCSKKAIDSLAPVDAARLRARLAVIGLKKPKLDFRGKLVGP
jgi:hypothetical protein